MRSSSSPARAPARASPTRDYEAAGATLGSGVWDADAVVKVAPPSQEETQRLGGDSRC